MLPVGPFKSGQLHNNATGDGGAGDSAFEIPSTELMIYGGKESGAYFYRIILGF